MINPNNLCPGCMNEKVTEGKCPICGYNPEEPQNPSYLAPGYMLDARYCIGKVIDQNGESVTYLGYDTVTATTVNIREFMPVGLCERDVDGATIIMLSGCEYSFNDSLEKFIELSRELFRLNELPALFDVLDVRESNNTAYRVTRDVPGISLREFLMRNGGILKWDQARSLFAPLVASISALHKAGIVHRGISPDTLIVGKDGKLRLNGFLIPECRTAKSALTSQLFPGFAAVEQYGVAGTQGPWTDVYAFAATIYRTLVGNPPPEATERLENDNMTIPAKIARETPKAVLETLANALQVLPDDRTQNIDDMRRGLSVSSVQVSAGVGVGVGTGVQAGQVIANNQRNAAPQRAEKPKKKKGTGLYGLVAGIVTAFLLAVIIFFVLYTLGVFSGDSDTTSSGNGLESVQSFTSVPSELESLPSATNGKLELVNFVGHNYTDVILNQDYKDNLKFKISYKEYSDEYMKGQIISQNPKVGEIVDVGTTVEMVVSLGPANINMIDVIGQDRDSALLELLKAGFSIENITFEEKYVKDAPPGVVLQTDPEPGMRIGIDTKVTVTLNSFFGNEVDPPTGSSSPTDTDTTNPESPDTSE